MADNTGWISLHRKIQEHWLWKDKPFSKAQAWIDILLECNHKEQKQLIKGKLIVTKRGESTNSIKTWAKRWGWTFSRTRDFLKILESDLMITLKNERITTRLSVINYSTYQIEPIAKQLQNNRIPIAEQSQTNTNNNDNNDNNIGIGENPPEIPIEPENYFESHFYQMLPADYLETWKQYVLHQFLAGVKIHQYNVTSHLKAFKECWQNGIMPPVLLEAFQQSTHKGLYYVSQNLIEKKEKDNGTNKSNTNKASVQSRLNYQYDEDKARDRLAELEEQLNKGN